MTFLINKKKHEQFFIVHVFLASKYKFDMLYKDKLCILLNMKYIELSKLKTKEKGIIKEINLENKIKNRLLELGLVENTEIKVIKYAPLGDPIQISVRGYQLAIRKETAKKIKVQKLEGWRRK